MESLYNAEPLDIVDYNIQSGRAEGRAPKDESRKLLNHKQGAAQVENHPVKTCSV